MSKVNKQHELRINISPANRSNIITNTTFFSMDVKTGKKVIHFTHENEPVDLTAATVMLGFEFVATGTSKIIDSKDGSVVIEDAKAGTCSVVLPNHLYEYEGQVLVHVYITFEDGRSLDCGVIVTQFEESWLDSELEEMSAFYVKRFEDLANHVKARIAELEEKLKDVGDKSIGAVEFDLSMLKGSGILQSRDIDVSDQKYETFLIPEEVTSWGSTWHMNAYEQAYHIGRYVSDPEISQENKRNVAVMFSQSDQQGCAGFPVDLEHRPPLEFWWGAVDRTDRTGESWVGGWKTIDDYEVDVITTVEGVERYKITAYHEIPIVGSPVVKIEIVLGGKMNYYDPSQINLLGFIENRGEFKHSMTISTEDDLGDWAIGYCSFYCETENKEWKSTVYKATNKITVGERLNDSARVSGRLIYEADVNFEWWTGIADDWYTLRGYIDFTNLRAGTRQHVEIVIRNEERGEINGEGYLCISSDGIQLIVNNLVEQHWGMPNVLKPLRLEWLEVMERL